MALKTNNLPLNVLNCELGDVDEAIFHRVEMNSKAFSTVLAFKKLFRRICRSDILSRRMALWIHNLPSVRLKNDFREVDEAMFQGVERPCKLIFCILVINKSDLDEFACDLIRPMSPSTHYLPSGRLKNDFGEIDEAMFQGVERPCELIFCNLSIKKKRLGRGRLSDVLRRRMGMRTLILPSGSLKIRLW
jgi:hypothetical protein